MAEETITPSSIADGYLDQVVALSPLVAASLGVHPGDERQLDLSVAGFEARAGLARGALRALDGLAGRDAGRDAGGDAGGDTEGCGRLLRERLGAELAEYDAGDHFRQLRNIASPVQSVREIFTLMPTATDEDWAAVAGRLRNVAGALAGYRQTLGEGIARGLLAAPRQAAAVADQLTAWTGERSGGPSGGAGWFAGFVAGAPERLRPELEAAAGQAAAAAAEFRDWLRADYLPAAEGTADGVGRERYLRAARQLTGADLDVDEAYGWAWSEFHRMKAEMRAEADRVLPGASPLAAMRHLDAHGHAVEGEQGIRALAPAAHGRGDRRARRPALRHRGPAAHRRVADRPAGQRRRAVLLGPQPGLQSAGPHLPAHPGPVGPSRPGSWSAPGTTRVSPATTSSSPSGTCWPAGSAATR